MRPFAELARETTRNNVFSRDSFSEEVLSRVNSARYDPSGRIWTTN